MKIVLLLMLLSAPVLACEKDCPPFPITSNQIVCACDQTPIIGEPVKPSEEKPRMSGQPVEQVIGAVIDKAKPAEAVSDNDGMDALAAKTARQTDRELAAREKALGIK